MSLKYQAILFDLLTALIDSWTVWNETAGSIEMGRKWRAEYLKLTYGCGKYVPYENLVAEAAETVGLGQTYAKRLEDRWEYLALWPEANPVLTTLAKTHKLGVVTNCSERLGLIAAAKTNANFHVIVTAERAGFYKPDPRPYQLAVNEMGISSEKILFVAGSGFDLFGTSRVGLDTYWHNRVGLKSPDGAPPPMAERTTLSDLPGIALLTTAQKGE